MTNADYAEVTQQARDLLESIRTSPSGQFTGIDKLVFWSNGQVQLAKRPFEQIKKLEKRVADLEKVIARKRGEVGA